MNPRRTLTWNAFIYEWEGLPRGLQAYYGALFLLAALFLAGIYTRMTPAQLDWENNRRLSVPFFLALTTMAAMVPYRLPGIGELFRPTFALEVASFLVCGPWFAAWIGLSGRVLAVLVGESTRTRVQWVRALVRGAEGLILYGLAVELYVLSGRMPAGTPFWFLPVSISLVHGFTYSVLAGAEAAIRYRVSLSRHVLRDLAMNTSNTMLLIAGGGVIGYVFVRHPITPTGLAFALAFTALLTYATRLYTGVADMHWSALRALSQAVENRNPYRGGHGHRVARYAVAVARKLQLPESQVLAIYVAAWMHEIGLIHAEDVLLERAQPPKPKELAAIHEMLAASAEMAAECEIVGGTADAVRYHRHWYNGHGHPEGPRGQQLPIEARVLAVCNAYDSLQTPLGWKPALSAEQAWQEVKNLSYTRFDPQAVAALGEVLAEEKKWGNYVFNRSYHIDYVGDIPRW